MKLLRRRLPLLAPPGLRLFARRELPLGRRSCRTLAGLAALALDRREPALEIADPFKQSQNMGADGVGTGLGNAGPWLAAPVIILTV
jgi:hypothetical protein